MTSRTHPYCRLLWYAVIIGISPVSHDCKADDGHLMRQMLNNSVSEYEKNKDGWPDTKLVPIASAYFNLGKYEEALALFKRCISVQPESYDAWRGYGIVLLTLGHFQEALDPLRRTLKCDGDVRALEALVEAYIKLKLYDAAYDLIPQLVDHKYDDGDRPIKILLDYAYNDPDLKRAKDVLNLTLEGLSDKHLAHNRTLSDDTTIALRRFGMADMAYDISTLAANKAKSEVKANPAAASIGNPFINSLGMAFVPTGTQGILFCRTDTTVENWSRFRRKSIYGQPRGMFVLTEREKELYWIFDKYAYWDNPGFGETRDNPVVGVSWDDANAFCKWLSKEEGRNYRLPTDAEWSEAAGPALFPWGDEWPPPGDAGNFSGDEASTVAGGLLPRLARFRDGYPFTSPVGKFCGSKYGLFDMAGNVMQWCQDEFKDAMNDPSGSKVLLFKNCRLKDSSPLRVTRGGAWCFSWQLISRNATRKPCPSDGRVDCIGFRCVLVLPNN